MQDSACTDVAFTQNYKQNIAGIDFVEATICPVPCMNVEMQLIEVTLPRVLMPIKLNCICRPLHYPRPEY